MNSTASSDASWPALAGPIALGLALGFGSGVRAMLSQSLVLPALVIGLTIALAPALYIGLSLAGAAPPASEVVHAVRKSLCTAGMVMVGLTPATLFLVASTSEAAVVDALEAVVVGGAAALGLRRLAQLLFAGKDVGARAALVYAAWGSVALMLGGKLLSRWGGFS